MKVENNKELVFYMKLSGNNTGLKLYSLGTLFMLLLMTIGWFLKENNSIGVVFFLLLASATLVGLLKESSNFFNTTILKLSDGNLIIENIPFSFFKKKKIIPFDDIEAFYIKSHGRNFYKLTMSRESKQFPITIMSFIRDKSILENIVHRVNRYIER